MKRYKPDESFPSRERGLKYRYEGYSKRRILVVPLAGTWIEIQIMQKENGVHFVVPLAGTWIEMMITIVK